VTVTAKWKFDAVLAAIILVWFAGGRALLRGPDLSVFLTQAAAALAFLFLSATLGLGPLARLWRPATRLIYNRRHLGVTTWALGAFHGGLVMHFANHWKPANLILNLPEEQFLGVPFPLFGVAALAILSVMAATSWDYFFHTWGAPAWKRLHIAVYAAYGFIVIHALTRLASNPGPIPWKIQAPFFAVVLTVAALHLAAAVKEALTDRQSPARQDGLIPLGDFSRLPEGRAVTAFARGERIAVVRMDGALYALSNVCTHQNGPLGEGCVRDGYLECPWHGYQFDPRTGQAPPGFDDSVPTYPIVTIDGITYLKRQPAACERGKASRVEYNIRVTAATPTAARWRAVCLVTLAVFLALSAVVATVGILPGDVVIRRAILDTMGDPLHEVAKVVNLGGKFWVLGPALLLLLWYSAAARRHWWLWWIMLLVAGGTEQMFKYVIGRPRPSGGSPGFPSGHTTAVTAFAVLLIYILAREHWPRGARWTLSAAAVLLMALVGWARIMLHAHWPSDVLGGLLVGTACAAGAAWWDSSQSL